MTLIKYNKFQWSSKIIFLLLFISISVHYYVYRNIYVDILSDRNIYWSANENLVAHKGQQYRLDWRINAAEIKELKNTNNNNFNTHDLKSLIVATEINNRNSFLDLNDKILIKISKILQSIISNMRNFLSKVEMFIKSINPILYMRNINGPRGFSISNSAYGKNDYIECDLNSLKITKEQKELITTTYTNLVSDHDLLRNAKKTNILITPHFVYRYYAAVDWTPTYNSESFEKAIRGTINWRADYKINDIDTSKIRHMIDSNLTYIADKKDKYNRAILYFKGGYNVFKESTENYLSTVMYTIERVEKESIATGNGQFIVIIDIANVTFGKCPPIKFITTAITYLKNHYPYRLAGIYVLNTGGPFQFLWNIVKPLMPKKALGKTFVLSRKEANKVLEENIGLKNLEPAYTFK